MSKSWKINFFQFFQFPPSIQHDRERNNHVSVNRVRPKHAAVARKKLRVRCAVPSLLFNCPGRGARERVPRFCLVFTSLTDSDRCNDHRLAFFVRELTPWRRFDSILAYRPRRIVSAKTSSNLGWRWSAFLHDFPSTWSRLFVGDRTFTVIYSRSTINRV